MAASTAHAEKNFWLWGTWGKRVIKAPFLTQKVDGKIRDVIIGHTFIIALKEGGTLVSWGEDKAGCLGLGTDFTHCADPKKIPFPSDSGKVVDIQFGKHHVLALTHEGRVYAWGDNTDGQLGLNDTQTRYEPNLVEELSRQPVTQILAVDNMSYALTKGGVVYAWGENKEGSLALEHDNPRVTKPEPMMKMSLKESPPVKKLQIKESGGTGGGKGTKTVVAFVELAEPLTDKELIGGFDGPLGHSEAFSKSRTEKVLNDDVEKGIFEGVDLMRQVMDNTQDWWNHMLEVRHGSPYNDNPTQVDEFTDYSKEDNCTALQLDTFVSLDILEKASYELDMLIQSAKAQLNEIKKGKGTKNVKFMLSMFMDDCKLRREKIRRTVAARQLIDHKRTMNNITVSVADYGKDEVQRLTQANMQLTRTLTRVRNLKSYDVFTKALQDSVAESLECKLQVNENEMSILKANKRQVDPIVAPLKVIKERWGELKRFSIYNLYQECILRGQSVSFSSEDEMLAYLVQSSDSKIDQIIQQDRDKMVSRDLLVPSLCYDLLVEDAELRKMCNTYQLKVIMMKDRDKGTGPPALKN